jgi:hypothetical protein
MKNPDIRPNLPQAYAPEDIMPAGALIVIAVILIWIGCIGYLLWSAVRRH